MKFCPITFINKGNFIPFGEHHERTRANPKRKRTNRAYRDGRACQTDCHH
ncbi:hypothetical protein [Moraxella lacunata]